MSAIKHKLKKEASHINTEVRNKISGYIVGAFGLVAGLAWNDTIKSFIEYIFPLKENTLLAKFIYSVIITLIVVFVSVYILRFIEKKESAAENEAKKEEKNG
jgi:phosphotransferase system  glucose/maltose/N-acetylglucosamine-specific IIC component